MYSIMKTALGIGLAVLIGLAASAADKNEGFRPLFNGKDLSGWKLRNAKGTSSWKVEGGALVNDATGGKHGTDLVTEETFWNFTVRYEYKIPKGANSGFYLRGRHEIQILDDYAKGKPGTHGNGSIYGVKAPSEFTSKPAGEWNRVEATIIGNKITVVHNGVKIHDNVECNKATGSEIDRELNEPGPLFIQGDHGSISVRNIQIKELPKT